MKMKTVGENLSTTIPVDMIETVNVDVCKRQLMEASASKVPAVKCVVQLRSRI